MADFSELKVIKVYYKLIQEKKIHAKYCYANNCSLTTETILFFTKK